jgi:hypothetical protein
MNSHPSQTAPQAPAGQTVSGTVTYTVSRNGVASVAASVVLKSSQAKEQLAAVSQVREAVTGTRK